MNYRISLSSNIRDKCKISLENKENSITADKLKLLGFDLGINNNTTIFKISKDRRNESWTIKNTSQEIISISSQNKKIKTTFLYPNKEFIFSKLFDEKITIGSCETNHLIIEKTQISEDEPININFDDLEDLVNENFNSKVDSAEKVFSEKGLTELLEEYNAPQRNIKKKEEQNDNQKSSETFTHNPKKIILDEEEQTGTSGSQIQIKEEINSLSNIGISNFSESIRSECKIKSNLSNNSNNLYNLNNILCSPNKSEEEKDKFNVTCIEEESYFSDSIMHEVIDRINSDNFYLNKAGLEETANKTVPNKLGDNYTFTFQGKENLSKKSSKSKRLSVYNNENIESGTISTKKERHQILYEIKQRRQDFMRSTKKFGGDFNENGKRNLASGGSEPEFISAFKSKRLKKATDNRELQIELNASCAICLDVIQSLANLDNCKHDFCRGCILQWSKKTNLCPLCKKEFKKIVYYEKNRRKEVKVKKKKLSIEDEAFYEESMINSSDNCMVCGGGEDHSLMLVCDGCLYNVCHTYCDGLSAIPDNEWFCPECRNRSYGQNALRNISHRDLSEASENDEEYSPRVLLREEESQSQDSEQSEEVLVLARGNSAYESNRNNNRSNINNRNNNRSNINNRNNIRVDIRVNVNVNRRSRRSRSNR